MKKNVLIRFFTAFMLLFIISLANIGGCSDSKNGDDGPEPTPSASPSPPTPVATPLPTITPPTPEPTIAPTQPPAPTQRPPMKETSQKNAATAIANVCVSILENASGDEDDDILLAVYEDSFNQIMELDLPSGVSDLPVAIGNIRSAVITIAARGNDDLTALAEELASACEEDLSAL